MFCIRGRDNEMIVMQNRHGEVVITLSEYEAKILLDAIKPHPEDQAELLDKLDGRLSAFVDQDDGDTLK